MRDATTALKEYYYDRFDGNIFVTGDDESVLIFPDYVPNEINAPYYITFDIISGVDAGTMNSDDTDILFQIGIFTKDILANPGTAAKEIGHQIFSLVKPNPNSVLSLGDNFQNTVLKLTGDNTQIINEDDAIFINRFITFRHTIYHKPITVGSGS